LNRTILTLLKFDLPDDLWPIVAAEAGVPWPPQDREHARLFVEQAARERLLPILFFTAAPHPLISAELEGWHAYRIANRQRNVTMTQAISRLSELIGDDFVLMKGSDVAHRLYPLPELRPMGDLDILVRREAMEKIEARLASVGLRPRYWRLTHFSFENPDRAFSLGDVTLEVHHSVVHRASARIDYDALWNARVATTIAGLTQSRLSDVDAAVVAALNIAKDNLAAPLIRFLDLWLMLKENPALAIAAVDRGKEWRVSNSLYAVLKMTRSLFPQLQFPLSSRRGLDFLLDSDRKSDLSHLSRRERLWRKYWLLDGGALRVNYFLRIASAATRGFFRRSELELPHPKMHSSLP
jgi:hypothetical protein